MEEMEFDPSYYCAALKMRSIASPETVRQCLDAIGFDLAASDMLMEENVKLLIRNKAKPSPAATGHIPLDVDISVHDNSHTKKEGVKRTYMGIEGYAPVYRIPWNGRLPNQRGDARGGCPQPKQRGFILAETMRFAREATPEKLLVRMDAGYDAIENIELLREEERVEYIIKRNLRKECPESWLETAKQHGTKTEPREGKTVYTCTVLRDRGSAPLCASCSK